ncbi:hypothetical protein, partial [uncultured Amaricoccus sp.]|uniref:hypothetical protein n=1 Tax=uncultured Amaricoccus sp. TaxID=339341 RepID=UPI002612BEED
MRDADARPPVRQWRIHLGAHKTATSHLQETLAAVRDDLAGQGVDFIPNPLVRQRDLARTLSERRPIARLPVVGRACMRAAIEAAMAPLRAGPEVVVLSEENIVGMPDHMLELPCYPQAERNVSRLASLAGRAEVVFFLSIRSYDTLLPSAYVETLKHAPPPPGGFREAVAALLSGSSGWFDLASRIRAAAPAIPLRIWRQEDYRANARAIMEAVCGRALVPLPEISDPTWTRSPSAGAVAAAEALPRDLPRAERLARVRRIFAAGEPGADPFRPFGAAERRQLRARYEADLERIARVHPDVLMRFEP